MVFTDYELVVRMRARREKHRESGPRQRFFFFNLLQDREREKKQRELTCGVNVFENLQRDRETHADK